MRVCWTRTQIKRCHAAVNKVDITAQLKTQRVNIFHGRLVAIAYIG